MKILFLTPCLPHPTSEQGAGNMLFHLIKALAKKHALTVLCFIKSAEETRYMEALEACGVDLRVVEHDTDHISKITRLLNLSSLKPSWALHYASPEMRQRITETLDKNEYDIVQIEFIQMAVYIDRIPHPNTIVTEHVDYQGHLFEILENEPWSLWKAYAYLEWLKSRRYEQKLRKKFRKIFTLTPQDRDALISKSPGLDISILRWPIDPGILTLPRKEATVPTLLFVGNFVHPANRDAVKYFSREVFPRIQEVVNEVEFHIIGKNPPDSLRRLSNPAIVLNGYVKDILSHYAQAHVSVAPVRFGTGFKTKVYEAMGAGVPVVTTSEGTKGIEAENGTHYFVADDPEAFAARTLELLQNADRREEMSRQGRNHIRRLFSAEQVLETLENVYNRLTTAYRDAESRNAQKQPEGR